MKAAPVVAVPSSRAVLRDIDAGFTTTCAYCGEHVKFQAKTRRMARIIANVYGPCGQAAHQHGRGCGGSGCAQCLGSGQVWLEVQHFHAACYLEAGEPYGPARGKQGERHFPERVGRPKPASPTV